MCNFFDKICMRLWTSSRDDLSNSVYGNLINYLYSCGNTVLTGAVGMFAVNLVIAARYDITSLYFVLIFVMAPIVFWRHRNFVSFNMMSIEEKAEKFTLFEARYSILAILYFIALAVLVGIVMVWGPDRARDIVTMGAVGNIVINAIRNAYMYRLVKIQTAVLMSPVCGGLLLNPDSVFQLTLLLIVILVKGTHEVTLRINKDTIEAHNSVHKEQLISRYDNLTGLINRRYFHELLKEKIASGRKISILFADLDRFKSVNDTQGHRAGDHLLVLVARRFESIVDLNTTTIARVGGDEFIFMTTEDPMPIARKIVAIFERPFDLENGEAYVGCSVGVNTMETPSSAEDLVKNADIALYAAKNDPGNAIRVFDATMADATKMKVLMENRLRHALEAGGISPFYQPIVDMLTGKVVAVEALARWNDEVLGEVGPEVFIPIAESLGVIEQLGEAMLFQSCRDAASWKESIIVAVNVSSLQLKNPDRFKKAVARCLRDSGLPGWRLELEITESAMIENFTTALDTVVALKASGIRFALDDFGSGYSSLSYLERIPFDKIKIDRGLMRAALHNSAQRIVIEMVARIARELKCETVVEGIETESQAARMIDLGIEHGQGYLFGKPSRDQDMFKTSASGFGVSLAQAPISRRLEKVA